MSIHGSETEDILRVDTNTGETLRKYDDIYETNVYMKDTLMVGLKG